MRMLVMHIANEFNFDDEYTHNLHSQISSASGRDEYVSYLQAIKHFTKQKGFIKTPKIESREASVNTIRSLFGLSRACTLYIAHNISIIQSFSLWWWWCLWVWIWRLLLKPIAKAYVIYFSAGRGRQTLIINECLDQAQIYC